MTIPFIIRDDDLCYFTDASELRISYSEIWSSFPITFAAVPWQSGACAGHVPLAYWHSKLCFPIGNNHALVSLIKEQYAKGRIDIALHGIHHTYAIKHKQFVPELIDFSGDFEATLALAKRYLDDLFDIDVNIFVPPSNTMRSDLAKILIKQVGIFLTLQA